MDKEQWKELWIRRQSKDRGTIERAINVIKVEKSKERWTRKQAMCGVTTSEATSDGKLD